MTPCYLLPELPSEGLINPEEWVRIGEICGFTGRELNVAILLFETKTRASIARRLTRSEGSVRKRIDSVFRKMNVKDRVGLVLRVWHLHRALFGLEVPGGSKMPLAVREPSLNLGPE